MNTNLMIAEQAINGLKSTLKRFDIGNPGEVTKSGVLELSVIRGYAVAVGVYKSEDIAVIELFASDGTTFAPHIHEGKTEVIQVIKGMIEVWIDIEGEDIPDREPDQIVNHYRAIILDPNVPHAVRVIGNMKCIVSTMPAEDNYPDGRK